MIILTTEYKSQPQKLQILILAKWVMEKQLHFIPEKKKWRAQAWGNVKYTKYDCHLKSQKPKGLRNDVQCWNINQQDDDEKWPLLATRSMVQLKSFPSAGHLILIKSSSVLGRLPRSSSSDMPGLTAAQQKMSRKGLLCLPSSEHCMDRQSKGW